VIRKSGADPNYEFNFNRGRSATSIVEAEISILISKTLSETERLRQFAEEFITKNHLDENARFALNLSLEEIVSNIIKYAHQDNKQHEIHLELSLQASQLTVVIQDDGGPFDPTIYPEPDLSIPVEQRAIGGLGIHLVRNFMDFIEYQRIKDKNILILKKQVKIEKQ
jgi:anti-sigma regulatory factor (Ser/Thr protein kinase)